MKPKFQERGQALIIIALAAVLLFGMTSLVVDGSRAYSDRRQAQNAADTSALAGALAYTRSGSTTTATTAVTSRVKSNGYSDNGTTHLVSTNFTAIPKGNCPGDADGQDVQVIITSTISTSLAKVIGQTQI